jgi:uncharacterized protein (DUF1697 family)
MPSGAVQIALLRGVMPTGRNRVPMVELRALLEDLGFTDVRTYIASGNAVFRSNGPVGAELEALLEDAIAERIGPRLDVMARDADWWAAAMAACPFPEVAAERPSKLLMAVLKRAPGPEAARAFEALADPPDQAKVIGDVAWIVFTDAASLKRFTPAGYKRTIGCSGTGRNWNTVVRLQALAAEAAGG